MNRLPRASQALVEDAKVRDYLLNAAHPKNLGKAALFEKHGFVRDGSPLLARALRAHPLDNDVLAIKTSQHGLKYIVEGRLSTPDGRDPRVRSA